MWSEYTSIEHQVPGGTYIHDLEQEARVVESGEPYLALLDCLALIRVSGEEAGSFLQGQVTCDINQMGDQQAVLGAHCNAKGRAQATFICVKQDADYLLLLPSDQVAGTVQVLSKFAMFSKADVSPEPNLLLCALGGGSAPELSPLIATVFTLPELGTLGILEPAAAQALLQGAQEKSVTVVGDNAWMLSQINAGVVHITANQSEQWIPQEINYDLIQGINFKKGCYKGQEIVARIHYRGQTKVRVFPLEIHGCEQVRVGDKILSAGYQGTVLSVAKVSDRTLKVLTTLKTERSESENLQLEQNDGCEIRVLPLPYAIT
ncbi:YgfZ/GcvT domain-containing protein [Ketobacter sp.]|uniref:CAF17-like 4Fe-4S cluster assembly/insertion protein YgfZ n=1 Tax=Ketobacter sp. TaxID=2083498 RepID=UPI0025BCB5AB|nr:hypothetical protein [Ketobacter sp.]